MILRRISFLIALVGLSLSSPALATNVTIALENAHAEELDRAFQMVVNRDPAGAEAIFARVITDYEGRAEPDREYYCAEDMEDAARVAARAMFLDSDDVTILGPGWCQALFGRGFALIDLNRSNESGPLLARAVKMAPTRPHYLNEYAEWYKTRRQWQVSYDLFEQAWNLVDHDQDGPDRRIAARSLRGMGYNKIELGDLDGAERLFRQSQEYDRENPNAANELRYIDQLRGRRRN